MNQEDVNTLLKINDQLNNPISQENVQNAQIHNPSKEVTNALSGFITARLEKISDNESFGDLVKLHIRQRLPEATFDQLMQLNHEVEQDNNVAIDNMMKLFRNETSGKTVIEHLKDNDISSISDNLYKNAQDKKILQAVTYLGQIMAQIQQQDSTDVEFVVEDQTN